MMNRRTMLRAGASLALFPVAARAQGSTPLRIAVSPGEAVAEPYYAMQAGYLSRAGFAAELITLTNGGAVSAAVVSGSADVGVTNVASLADAHSHGVPLFIVAPSTIASSAVPPASVLSVPASSPLREPRDFVRKTIGLVALRDLQQAALMTWLAKGGVDPQSVNFIEVPNPQQLLALRSKRIDAALLVEPWLSEAKDEVRTITAPYDSLAPVIMTHVIVANAAWLQANRPAAKHLAEAVTATARWANAHPQSTAPMLSAFTKIPLPVILNMHRLQFGERLDPREIQPIIDAAARFGFLPHAFPASEMVAPL